MLSTFLTSSKYENKLKRFQILLFRSKINSKDEHQKLIKVEKSKEI